MGFEFETSSYMEEGKKSEESQIEEETPKKVKPSKVETLVLSPEEVHEIVNKKIEEYLSNFK